MLEIDLIKKKVTLEGREVHLTHKQRTLLFYLAKHPDRIFDRNHLLNIVWGVDNLNVVDTSVSNLVYRIRERFGRKYSGLIQTYYSEGYRLNLKKYLKIVENRK